jgi:nitrogen fixation/metabolism regulation signal transduction histidine kinase
MNSLGNKIQLAFVVSISTVAFCALLMLSINQINSLQTQRLVDTMTTEYSLISLSNDLVQTYNAVTKSPQDTQLTARYQSLHTQILSTLTALNKTIVQQETRMLFAGVNRTVHAVINECDMGLAEVKKNIFTSLSDHYSRANTNNVFVSDNTKTLLGNELNNLYISQQNVQHMYIITIVGSAGLFLLIIFIIIGLAHSFTSQLVKPLTTLSVFAKDIAGGNLQAMNSQTLTKSNDEIGSLTESIRVMVNKLVDMLGQQQKANEEIKKTTNSIRVKNDELSRMNALMVGRELKMAELKKEIEELKMKTNAAAPTPQPQ